MGKFERKKKAFRALPVLVNTGYFEEHMKSPRMHMFHVKLAILKHHTAHVRFGKNYPHFPSTFLVSALPGYWKYVRS